MTPSLVWTSCLPVSRVNIWLDSRLAGSPIWVTVDLMAGLPGLVFCKFAYFASDEVTQIGDPACFLVGDFRAVVGVIHAQIQTKISSLHVIPYLLRACRLSDCRLHRQPSPGAWYGDRTSNSRYSSFLNNPRSTLNRQKYVIFKSKIWWRCGAECAAAIF